MAEIRWVCSNGVVGMRPTITDLLTEAEKMLREEDAEFIEHLKTGDTRVPDLIELRRFLEVGNDTTN